MNVTHLECANCHQIHEANTLHNLCVECGKPLLVRYDLHRAAENLTKDSLIHRPPTLWRYREVLPVEAAENIISLGEGLTPLLKTEKLAAALPVKLNLFVKDESTNPTQSFKARGMTAAVSMAKELGVKKTAAVCRKCGGRFGGVCRACRYGSSPVYAERHAAREYYRMRTDGRVRHFG
jgi:threonine synthase